MQEKANPDKVSGERGTPQAGLEVKARMELFAAGRLCRLDPGTTIVCADAEDVWRVVMTGRARIGSSRDAGDTGAVGVLEEGAWIAPHGGRVEADGSCTMMEVSRTALEGLLPETRLHAYQSAIETLGSINKGLEAGLERVRNRLHGAQRLRDQSHSEAAALLHAPPVNAFLDELPALPPSAAFLVQSGGETSMDEVVRAVKGDPGLAALVLKVGNSAAFQGCAQIADIQQACLRLGYAHVYQIALRQAVGGILEVGGDLEEVQDHATWVAAVASEIAFTVSKKDVQIANTIGLLHHVGVMALAQFSKRQPQNEWLAGLLDQAQLGARLLEIWQLPARVARAVAIQDRPEAFAPESVDPAQRVDLAILHVAHACVHYLTEPDGEFSGPYLEEYFSLLKMPYPTCAEFAEQGLRKKLRLRLPDHLGAQLDPEPSTIRCA